MAIYALKVEMYLGRDLKRKLFDHLQTLDFSYYNTTPVGTIMARLMSDTGKIGTVLAWSLVDIFWSSMYVLGCVVIMLFVNWKLALILIAIIPIIAVITVVFQKKILAVNRRVRAINARSPVIITKASPAQKHPKRSSSKKRTTKRSKKSRRTCAPQRSAPCG